MFRRDRDSRQDEMFRDCGLEWRAGLRVRLQVPPSLKAQRNGTSISWFPRRIVSTSVPPRLATSRSSLTRRWSGDSRPFDAIAPRESRGGLRRAARLDRFHDDSSPSGASASVAALRPGCTRPESGGRAPDPACEFGAVAAVVGISVITAVTWMGLRSRISATSEFVPPTA
jgi:hypothetical protein